MEETYTFKYDENISKEFLTKISTNFVITKVIIILNKIVENDSIKRIIRINEHFINIIPDLVSYFNNKIEYSCAPYLNDGVLELINNNLINNNVELFISEHNLTSTWSKCEWIECEFIIKESKILILELYYNFDKIENNLIIESNVFNDYNKFKNYFLIYTKITEEQYKIYMLDYYKILYIKNNNVTLRFKNNLNDNDNIIIFNDNVNNL
jgi:hypothetical protein